MSNKSQTQYCFNVGLHHHSELRGVALLGHQTLAELHKAISDALGLRAALSFSFHFGGVEVEESTRLDDLNLRVGETFDYLANSINGNRHENIIVDFIDEE